MSKSVIEDEPKQKKSSFRNEKSYQSYRSCFDRCELSLDCPKTELNICKKREFRMRRFVSPDMGQPRKKEVS